ncbi:MAG: PAS domain S-box protein, partial [Anaerolineales bacterium]|nr:PAS domain S-box protein [Anaerolineales bacterium]
MSLQNESLDGESNHLQQEIATLKEELRKQKRVLEGVRASEAKYRTLVEQAGDGILILQGARIQYANEVLARWWNSSVEELIGSRFSRYVYPEDLKPLFAYYRQKQSDPDFALPYEMRLRTKEGKPLFVELNFSRILYNNRPADLIIIRDITARKQAEQALFHRERLLQAVSFIAERFLAQIEWEPDIPLALERLGRAADVSRVYIFENRLSPEGQWLACQRYEWCAEGIEPQIDNPDLAAVPLVEAGFERWVRELSMGRPIINLVREMPDSERDLLSQQSILSIAVVPIISGGKWWGFMGFDECRYERIWESAEIDILQTAGRVFGAALERRRYEQTLAQSEARYRALFDQNQDAVLLFDHQGRCMDFNPQAVQLLGYSAEDFASLHWHDLLVKPEEYTPFQRVWQANRLLLDECSVRHKKLHRFDAEVRTEVVRNPAGEPKLLHCTIRDIRAQKRRQRELEAEAMLTQLVGMSLDLRSLLERLLQIARHAIPAAHKGSVLLLEPDGSLRVHAVSGYSDKRIYSLSFAPNQGYAAQCVRERRPLYIPDVRLHEEFRYNGDLAEAATVHSAIVAPLVIHGQAIGAISLDSEQPDAFEEEDLISLNNFVTSAVLLIHNARLFENLQKQAQETAFLLDASLALNSLDLPITLQTIGQRAKTIFNADGCRIFLLEPDGQTLRCELALQENLEAFSTLRIKV